MPDRRRTTTILLLMVYTYLQNTYHLAIIPPRSPRSRRAIHVEPDVDRLAQLGMCACELMMRGAAARRGRRRSLLPTQRRAAGQSRQH